MAGHALALELENVPNVANLLLVAAWVAGKVVEQQV
jgi:hypothetical protein